MTSRTMERELSLMERPALSRESETIVAAAGSCRFDRSDPAFASSHGGKTFDEFYGKNSNGSDAFRNCVRQKTTTTVPRAAKA